MAAGWKKRWPVLAHLHFGSHGRDRQYDVNLGKSSNESWWLIQNNIQQFVNGICFLKNSWKIWWLPSEIQTWLGNPPPKLRFLPGKIIELNGVWVPEGLWKNIHETNQGFPMSQATTPALTNNVTSRRDRKHWLNFGAFGSLSRFRSCGKLKVSIRSSLVPLFVVGSHGYSGFSKLPPFILSIFGILGRPALGELPFTKSHWPHSTPAFNDTYEGERLVDILSPGNLTLMLVTMAPWYTQLVRLKPVSIRIRNGKTTWQERSVNMCILHLQLAQEGQLKSQVHFPGFPCFAPRCIQDKQTVVWSIVWRIFHYLAERIVPCRSQRFWLQSFTQFYGKCTCPPLIGQHGLPEHNLRNLMPGAHQRGPRSVLLQHVSLLWGSRPRHHSLPCLHSQLWAALWRRTEKLSSPRCILMFCMVFACFVISFCLHLHILP